MENNNGEGILSQIENYPKIDYVSLDPAQLDTIMVQENYIQELFGVYGTLLNKEMIAEEASRKQKELEENIIRLACYCENAVNNSPIAKLQSDEKE